MKSRTVYLVLALVFVLSVGVASFHTLNEVVTVVAPISALVAVMGAVFQFFRDQLAHDRAVSLQAAQQSYSIGATSHMATVAFNKHVSFCEEYVAEMQRTFSSLLRTGPSEEALASAVTLYGIRQRSVLWITARMASELQKFESALQQIGAQAHFVEAAPDHPKRSAAIDEMFRTFAEVTGMRNWEGQSVSPERAVDTVIQRLREVLGIDALTELREALITQAQKNARA